MKKIILYIAILSLVLCAAVVTVSATETELVDTVEITETIGDMITEAATEATTETDITDESVIIDAEDASEIIDIIENSDNRSDVVLAIISKYGCTPEEAEEMLDTFIALGDKYLGENSNWIGFKKDVQENTQFWIVVIMGSVAILAIVGGTFVLLGKTNPTMRRAMFGMSESLKISDGMTNKNSQTLEEMKGLYKETMDKLVEYKAAIKDKDDEILALNRHIETLKTAIKKERSNMLYAEMYNLRMLKLIIDRTTMPVADKSTIDHWYEMGIDAIKEELSPEDAEKADAMLETLNVIGGESNGEDETKAKV